MEAPHPEDVRQALSRLDHRQQKIVAGMLAVMVREPGRVRDREWIAEQLSQITLLALADDAETPEAVVRVVQDFLRTHAEDLLRATYLLFQRVGLDLAPRTAEGFTFEEALRCGLAYLPSRAGGEAEGSGASRDLGEQPLARLMAERGLKPSDLVAASSEQLTHKMVTRAMKGRRLTANTMGKVLRAWNQATASAHGQGELFDYEPG